jgi:hypothetical protein
MAAITGIRLMMDMLIRMGAAHRRAIDIGGVELEHLGFAVIDPDDCMIVVAHGVDPNGLPRRARI